ncbi:hypothetical protein [Aquicoccus sp. SU-CL01552]|uniref:hypothetical protein n=1 Tax=Aquicoccus sp. SU-CL01552 TaxID=3127656 RepID=UPI00310A9E68
MRPFHLILSLPLLLLAAAPAPSQTQSLSAEAFDAYTRGKTLFYGNGGAAYGVERYLEGRRVIWSFLDGDCKKGVWYEEEGQICFLYEDRLDPQCWTFTRGPDGLIARFENDPEATELYEAEDIDEEMVCYGPDVGV